IFLKNNLHNDLLIPFPILLDKREIPHFADSVRNDSLASSGLGGRLSHHRTRRLRARRAPGKRQQRDIARALDGFAQPPLVARAHPGHAPGQNLPALLHELRKNVRALVVDEVHLLDAELADFLLAEILAFAAAWTSGSSAWPARTFCFNDTASTTRTTLAASTTTSAMSAFAGFARSWRNCRHTGSRGRGSGGWRGWRGLRLFLFL